MRVYVDESGCMGMKLHCGSSKFFAVVAVLFQQPDEASRCYDAIGSLKEELGIRHEFKFSKCQDTHRVRFLEAVRPFRFSYYGVVISKGKLAAKELCFSRPYLHFPVMGVFAQMADKMERATVVIDRTGSNRVRKDLAKSLRNEMNEKFGREVISRIKSLESHRHNLLQLADMICGSLTRSYDQEKKWHSKYRKIIARKEVAIIDWP